MNAEESGAWNWEIVRVWLMIALVAAAVCGVENLILAWYLSRPIQATWARVESQDVRLGRLESVERKRDLEMEGEDLDGYSPFGPSALPVSVQEHKAFDVGRSGLKTDERAR